ncbi:MAG: hypothetical protein ACTHMD_11590 [Flavisolibacter sp.]
METVAIPSELEIEIFRLQKAAVIFRAVNNKVRLEIFFLLHANKKMMVKSLYEKLQLD